MFQRNNIIIIYIVFGRSVDRLVSKTKTSSLAVSFFVCRCCYCYIGAVVAIRIAAISLFCDDKVHGNWFSFLCVAAPGDVDENGGIRSMYTNTWQIIHFKC